MAEDAEDGAGGSPSGFLEDRRSFPELSSVQNLGLEVRLKKSLECFIAYKRCPLTLCDSYEACRSGFALLC